MSRRLSRRMIAAVGAGLPVLAAAIFFTACNNKPTVVEEPADQGKPFVPTVSPGPAFYEDQTPNSGVNFTYRNGEESKHMAILESLGGGGALIDYDGDGLLDLFIPGGGFFSESDDQYYPRVKAYEEEKKTNPNAKPPAPPAIHGHPGKFYRNKGNFQFEDVTDKIGLDRQPDFFTHGTAVDDYDRDGWPDLLVTGYGRVVLYHNESDGKGGRRFLDVTEKAGLLSPNPGTRSVESGQPGPHFWSTSAAWGDLDGDGFPELYLCQYVNWSFPFKHPRCKGYVSELVKDGKTVKIERDVCPPKEYDSVPHALWRNNGNGTFSNVSKECGLRVEREDKDYGKGLGVLMIDVDGDRRADIYVCNDTTDNFLYMNRSTPGKLKFEEKGLALGVARDHHGVPNGSMGVDGADYEGSGRPAIWVTNYESEYHALYKSLMSDGRLSFTFNTPAAGLSVIGPNYVGFGTKFVDVDNDGWEDLVIANGHVIYFPPRDNNVQKPIIFMNMAFTQKSGPTRRFADGTMRGGNYFNEKHRGRGLAVGDLDNDGRPDLVFFPVNEPVRILRNVGKEGNNWLGVELHAKDKRNTVGTRLTLEVDDRKLVRFVRGGGSYMSAHDMRTIFGLGEGRIGKLTVEWAGGAKQEWDNLQPGKYHKLEER